MEARLGFFFDVRPIHLNTRAFATQRLKANDSADVDGTPFQREFPVIDAGQSGKSLLEFQITYFFNCLPDMVF
jgi:hypothetical protein